jgi:predicted nucleic acid-binding Zn ribbon protein
VQKEEEEEKACRKKCNEAQDKEKEKEERKEISPVTPWLIAILLFLRREMGNQSSLPSANKKSCESGQCQLRSFSSSPVSALTFSFCFVCSGGKNENENELRLLSVPCV